MKDKILFIDLDSTLILNSTDKKYLDIDKYVCVSQKYGEPTGFMTVENFRKLQEVSKKYTVIPITSRCLGSYMDVRLGFTPEYSLIDNGAILLNGREILVNWINYSEMLSRTSHEAFIECRKYLISLEYFEKWGSQFVLDFSTKREDVKDPKKRQEIFDKITKSEDSPVFKYVKDNSIEVYTSTSLRSVLIVSSRMTKEKSVKRFLDAIGNHESDRVYVAGDSEPDYCLLGAYDNSYGLSDSPAKVKFMLDRSRFSKDHDNISMFTSFILDNLLKN